MAICFSAATAAQLPKIYDLNFRENQTFYMFADAKATLRYTGIPSGIDIIQAHIVEDEQGPKAHILGIKSKPVEHSAGLANHIDINVEVLPEEGAKPSKSPIVLKLKCFRKLESGSYEIVSTINNYIRTKHCLGASEPACGMVKVKCRHGSANCVDGQEEVTNTFPNECELEKAGARLLFNGACP